MSRRYLISALTITGAAEVTGCGGMFDRAPRADIKIIAYCAVSIEHTPGRSREGNSPHPLIFTNL